MRNITALQIRGVTVDPPLALAPMVGLSHSALRSLIIELGGVGLLYTEMLSAKRLPQENDAISPCLIRTSKERPLFYQIFLNTSEHIVPAVEKLHRIGAEGIDLNLGCPAPSLRKKGAGCKLAEDHASVRKILELLRKNTDLPLSVKIRLGERNDVWKFLDLCRMIEGEGGDCLIVHARLNQEKFCRKPRWSWVEKAKNAVAIPVIANGGIFTVDDAKRCLSVTGADGLMIGRGAVMRPWIFSEISEQLYSVQGGSEKIMLKDIYMRFTELLTSRFSQERRLGRLKKFTHYFAGSYMFGHQLAYSVQTSTSLKQAKERAREFFESHEPLFVEGGRYV